MYAIISNLPKKKFKLKVREFSTKIDQDTMTYEATLEMIIPPEDEKKVLPGMLANVYISEKVTHGDATRITVPVQAVVAGPKGNTFVWIIDPATMQVGKRQVTTGQLINSDIVIKSGLKKKEWLAVSGANYLLPGQKVKKYK
jgi:multidrug efflux pump subunit AcrA (membrane-fusion protein)